MESSGHVSSRAIHRREFLYRTAAASGLVLVPFANRASGEIQGERELDLHREIQPVPLTAKFIDPEYNIWCGSMVQDAQGTCHLYYSRWPRSLGHQAWVTHSEIAHAIADHPLGSYRHQGVALPPRGKQFWDGLCTHNPTVLAIAGKYYLYYMGNTGDGIAVPAADHRRASQIKNANEQTLNWVHRNNQRIGVAVADSPTGPWVRSNLPLIDVTPGFFDAQCCSNPTVTPTPNGTFLMVYKAIGDKGPQPFGGPVVHVVATSAHPTGPFKKHPEPVFTKKGVMFVAEDPFIWRGDDRYWAVVKDNAGNFTHVGYSLALFESRNGLDWKLAKNPLVTKPELTWADGRHEVMAALERPQVWRQNGKPSVLFCAASGTAERDNTFNVAIPLGHPA